MAAFLPEFLEEKHVSYVKKISTDKESFEFVVTQHLRMSGVYWGLTALSLLGIDIDKELNGPEIVEWVSSCQDKELGGYIYGFALFIFVSIFRSRYGGCTGHDPHMLYTLSAIQIMILFDKLEILDKVKIGKYIGSLQQPDGSFYGDQWGEVDTRFSYCALSSLSLLGILYDGYINVEKAIEFVLRYQVTAAFFLSFFFIVYDYLDVRILMVDLALCLVLNLMLARYFAALVRCRYVKPWIELILIY